MKTLKMNALCILIATVFCQIYAQNYCQTVRGIVIDKECHSPVGYASVLLSNTTFHSGTITNESGEFKFENVPIGRFSLQVSCVGYHAITLSNLEVSMGKELIVNIEMTECVMKIKEITIKAPNNKERPLNSFAPVSARTFSVEESQRYAGSDNDVSRMAMNFAGVCQSAETTNEIVIRGNSPVGLLFRLEGVDIPNPSHFGDASTTGGPMSMLNNNLLSNSDFFTGAFPAEYGNALSGIFDLHLRNGNNEKHEFLIQSGLMGIEAGAEGPLSRNKQSSYLINFRYSTLGILGLIGLDVMGSAICDYQDITCKLNFPSTRIGHLSFFGLGGKSSIKMFDSKRDTSEERTQMLYESDYELDLDNNNHSGAIGLTHSCVLSNSAYTKLILSATTIRNYNRYDSLSIQTRIPILQYHSDFKRIKYAARFMINKKFSSQNTVKAGIEAEWQNFNLLDSIYIASLENYIILRDFSGFDLFSRAFVQFQYKYSDRLGLVIGLHGVIQNTKNKYSLEPRVGIIWEFIEKHSLNLGYGIHSINAPIEIVNQELWQNAETTIKPNTNLGFTKSHHWVAGYNTWIFNKIRIKSEIYYQYIIDALVETNLSSYSWLNHGAYTFINVPALKNGGKGRNYGIELTSEKFMDKGMYFLSTLSVFESKYCGSDGIWRNTAFNTNFVFNLLAGKEFKTGHNKIDARFFKKWVVDGRLNWAGGQRYTPIDMEASADAGTSVFDNTKAYSEKLQDYFRIDFRLAYKWEGKRSSQELAVDIRNLTNRENPFYVKFDSESGNIKTKGMGIMPSLIFRIWF